MKTTLGLVFLLSLFSLNNANASNNMGRFDGAYNVVKRDCKGSGKYIYRCNDLQMELSNHENVRKVLELDANGFSIRYTDMSHPFVDNFLKDGIVFKKVTPQGEVWMWEFYNEGTEIKYHQYIEIKDKEGLHWTDSIYTLSPR